MVETTENVVNIPPIVGTVDKPMRVVYDAGPGNTHAVYNFVISNAC